MSFKPYTINVINFKTFDGRTNKLEYFCIPNKVYESIYKKYWYFNDNKNNYIESKNGCCPNCGESILLWDIDLYRKNDLIFCNEDGIELIIPTNKNFRGLEDYKAEGILEASWKEYWKCPRCSTKFFFHERF